MDIERDVAEHYRHGSLESAILEALATMGKNVDKLDPTDLHGADEFHLGWHAQTVELANELGLAEGMRVLDIGSGIGGPARHFAASHRCAVTGIDLTDEFVQVANALTRRCGLEDRASFQQGSALSLPFADNTFDAATLIHVGMNIEDKATLFSEARRVLKAGGRFGVYDIMLIGEDEIAYPVPWAMTRDTSFVAKPETYRRLMQAAGFEIETERNRREFALRLGREMREDAERNGAPPLGLHTLMGPASRDRLANVMTALQNGIIAPIEIVARVA